MRSCPGPVNQRSMVASTTAAIPPLVTASMRAVQTSPPPMYAEVEQSTSLSNRSPCFVPAICPTMPPFEQPMKLARSMPSASSSPTASSVSSSML